MTHLFEYSKEKEYERIDNMIENQRFLTNEEFAHAESFLLKEIERNDKHHKAISALGDLYHFQATRLDYRARTYAKKALELQPDSKFDHNTLNNASGGKMFDWNVDNHSELIEYYFEFIAKNPQVARAYLYLLDSLLDDCRFNESVQVLEKRKQVIEDSMNDYYASYIVEKRDGFEHAVRFYEDCLKKYPTDWRTLTSVANSYATNERLNDAIVLFEKSFAVEEKPRYVDSLESIAQLNIRLGNKNGAIEAYKRELTLLKEEWNYKGGETLEKVNRKIAFLNR